MIAHARSALKGLSRRQILQTIFAASLASPSWAQDAPMLYPFTLGVASGDPAPDGFAIWTRLAPRPEDPHGGMPLSRPSVSWEIASDEAFETIVQSGTEVARPELAHSIHAEARGLQPHRTYWYRFKVAGAVSAVGRARTTPLLGASMRRVRFAALGCQNYEQGYFTAYRRVSEEDLDFVFHYGDYIYENEHRVFGYDGVARNPRAHIGRECYSLDDYRMRYAQYKSDPDLQAAHAAASWFPVFDDHEVSNNWAADRDQYDSPPEDFVLRRTMAMQAWYENMPLRAAQKPSLTGIQLFRRAQFGNLLQAHFLDTRQFRTDQPCGDGVKPACVGVSAADARMMNVAEETWLGDGLGARETRWNLIAQQVMMFNLDRQRDASSSVPVLNMDSWAGYEAPRQRLLNRLGAMKLSNVVMLTGDEHQNYANELRLRSNDEKSPIVAHEFVATSISSGGDGFGTRAADPCRRAY